MMHYDRGIYNSGWWFGFMHNGWIWLIGLVLLLIIIAVVYLLVKRNQVSTSGRSAIDSLKVKFAQGEISEEEYIKRKKVLEEK